MCKQFVKDVVSLAIPVVCVAGIWNGAARAADLTDGQIIAIYIQVNGFDIETALLGRAQATSAEARKLAEHVASDHLGVREGAYALAEKCKVAPVLPTERNAAAIDHDKAMAKLLALKGADFDKAYAEHEVAFHTAAIDAVKTALLPSAKCPELQEHFKQVLPAFEHHLMMTKELAAHVGK
jgi:putative membrane protein